MCGKFRKCFHFSPIPEASKEGNLHVRDPVPDMRRRQRVGVARAGASAVAEHLGILYRTVEKKVRKECVTVDKYAKVGEKIGVLSLCYCKQRVIGKSDDSYPQFTRNTKSEAPNYEISTKSKFRNPKQQTRKPKIQISKTIPSLFDYFGSFAKSLPGST